MVKNILITKKQNEEIGRVFGVEYTGVPGALKRDQEYIGSNRHLTKVVENIIRYI
jgi:hypothetical protein